MTTQPEALRLAEWIESDMSCHGDAEIAAELRRLAAENRALTDALFQAQEAAKALLAQRDALLEALKRAEPLLIGPILLQARAAIKQAEGENT